MLQQIQYFFLNMSYFLHMRELGTKFSPYFILHFTVFHSNMKSVIINVVKFQQIRNVIRTNDNNTLIPNIINPLPLFLHSNNISWATLNANMLHFISYKTISYYNMNTGQSYLKSPIRRMRMMMMANDNLWRNLVGVNMKLHLRSSKRVKSVSK